VQDVGGGDGVDVGSRRVGIVGAENVKNRVGARRSRKPWRHSRLDGAPVAPNEHLPRPGNEGRPHQQRKLARHRHVGRRSRRKVGMAAAVGDCIDERRLRAAILAEDVAREIVNLRAFA
jgi:hypothetical protein